MSIPAAARRVARLLMATSRKVVFAESCTGGLVSGALTAIPGISNHHCGGMVVYRNESKIVLLDIPRKLLDKKPTSPLPSRAILGPALHRNSTAWYSSRLPAEATIVAQSRKSKFTSCTVKRPKRASSGSAGL
jgi:hypothetical protein